MINAIGRSMSLRGAGAAFLYLFLCCTAFARLGESIEKIRERVGNVKLSNVSPQYCEETYGGGICWRAEDVSGFDGINFIFALDDRKYLNCISVDYRKTYPDDNFDNTEKEMEIAKKIVMKNFPETPPDKIEVFRSKGVADPEANFLKSFPAQVEWEILWIIRGSKPGLACAKITKVPELFPGAERPFKAALIIQCYSLDAFKKMEQRGDKYRNVKLDSL